MRPVMEDTRIIHLKGQWRNIRTSQLEQIIRSHSANHAGDVVLDFSKLDFLDATGVTARVSFSRDPDDEKRLLCIANPLPIIHKMLRRIQFPTPVIIEIDGKSSPK